MVDDELGSIGIRFETEFLGDETKLHECFVPNTELAPGNIDLKYGSTYALQILHRAARRSLTTNISIRYAPMLGVSR